MSGCWRRGWIGATPIRRMLFGCVLGGWALIGTCAPVSAVTLEQLKQRGTLVWGADAEGGGPFVYPADDDPSSVRGFEVELAELLASRLGLRAEFRQGQWDKLPDLLDRGDIDLVLNGYEWIPAWSQRFGCTIPYYVYELQMLVPVDDPLVAGAAPNDAADGRSAAGASAAANLEDLLLRPGGPKPRIAVLGGSAAERYARSRFGDGVDLVLYDGNTDAMRAVELRLDDVSATLQDLPIVTFYERRFPSLRRLGAPVAPGFYVGLTRRDDTELLAALNQAILAVWQDGSFPAVLKRYGMWNVTQQLRGLTVDSQGSFQPLAVAVDSDADSTGVEAAQSYGGWAVLRRLWPLLLKAAGVTVLLAVLAMPLAILAGLLIAIGRMYGPRWLNVVLTGYVELVRGTPLVLQLYLIFFLLPEIGISIPALMAGVLGLAMNYSAYEAEIYRAGLQAVPVGQMEAALSLGMSRSMAVRRVIVPQAVRIVVPPVTNDFIALFKDTAVCSVITIIELSKMYYIHARSTGAVLELGLATALLYLAMSVPLSVVVAWSERRLGRSEQRD